MSRFAAVAGAPPGHRDRHEQEPDGPKVQHPHPKYERDEKTATAFTRPNRQPFTTLVIRG